VEASIEHCTRVWDADREGVLRGPQHNTYDIEFHGPNSMLMSCYLAALLAVADMATACDADPAPYRDLAERCRRYLEDRLWDGRSFIQELEVRDDRGEHRDSIGHQVDSPELRELIATEGPRYQSTTGVLITAILGEWLAASGGLETGLDGERVRGYLDSVVRHNFKRDLRDHANPQRCGFALGAEGGTLLCTWPDGDAPALPFPYSNEVWTSLEYQTASHLLRSGASQPAHALVAAARARYDGSVRNPFDEMECGHWYGRALASWDLVSAWCGARYDAVTRTMHLAPANPGDCAAPFFAGAVCGLVGVRDGEPFYESWQGELAIEHWDYRPRSAALAPR